MLSYDQLVNDMAMGVKPRADWRIGIEYERFAHVDGRPLPYDAAPGIRQFLLALAAAYEWRVVTEAGNPIALAHDGFTITLEPGGQVEYSGAPHADIHAAKDELERVVAQLDAVAARLGIGFMACGFPPAWTRADVQWMPKARYKIMRPYMERVGALGVDMMTRTAGAQVNLDFSSEADMVAKFRVAMALQPLLVALMAHSRMVEGRDSGYESYRAHIWTDTDPARCGVLPFVFEPGMGFARYVDYALDVPMYLIRRDGQYVDMTGQSFRDYMKTDGATIADWHDHLTTLFPDVRLKRYLEMRGPDSHNLPMVTAMAAFWTGLLYDDAALDAALSRVMEHAAVFVAPAIRADAARYGLAGKLPGTPWGDWCGLAADMLDLAQKGLQTTDDLLLPFRRRLNEHCPARMAV